MEVRHYVSRTGKDVFDDWLSRLADARAKAKIASRINRLAVGNFGDCKPLGQGLCELRIDWGPGYRVYYAMVGRVCVLLLCGGDKRKQSSDIDRALKFLRDYKERTGPHETKNQYFSRSRNVSSTAEGSKLSLLLPQHFFCTCKPTSRSPL